MRSANPTSVAALADREIDVVRLALGSY